MRDSIKAIRPVGRFVGVPWRSGGRDERVGLDCWGVVLIAARECYGLVLPDYRGYTDANNIEETARIFENREKWERIEDGRECPGDVVVLRLAGTPAHAGLVVGLGLMLHSLEGRDSCVERYGSRAWRERVEGIYRWSPR